MKRRDRFASGLALLLVLIPSVASAASSFFDRRETRDTSGLLSISIQDAVPISLALASAGCSLWEGTEERLGKTCWESSESVVIGGIAAEALQYATGRQGPSETASPNRWFSETKGSFPSVHVTATTAAVTPFIFQYAKDDPWFIALALLPVYEMVARVEARAHWQTDVLAGALLGLRSGYYEYKRNSPFVFYLLQDGMFAGFSKSF